MILYEACGRRLAAMRTIAVTAALGLVLPLGLPSASAQTQGKREVRSERAGKGAAPAERADRDSQDRITLNFKDADVESVIGAFGHLLGRSFVIDPRVRGKMTLETPQPVSRERAYELLQAALRSQGFAIVDTGTLTKVVPEADAKLQSSPVTAGRAPTAAGDQVVTQIFRLGHESATNLVPVLRPLISPNNTIVAYPNNNSLVITDYAANLQRVARIIATLDAPSTAGVEVIRVEHAVAADIAVAVNRMLDDTARASAGAQVDSGQRVLIMADPRLNAIMVRTNSAARMSLARSLIASLDQPSSQPGNVHVVYLRNAEAVKLAQTLRGVLLGASGTGAGGQPYGQGGTAGGTLDASGGLGGTTGATGGLQSGLQTGMQTGTGMQAQGGNVGAMQLQQSSLQPVTVQAGVATIAADPATNSLIITAPEPVYRNLRTVIDQLDTRRAQVYIESLIVEISAERAAELGVQWQFLEAPQGSTRVIGGTNLTPRGAGANILDLAANAGAMGEGLNLGVVRGTVTVPGVGEILNLGFLARALETNADANILATPNLLTLDNEEARIIIGQNVPFITGQFTNTGAAAGAVNPFQTIERRDVGTTLHVKPTISESGTVRMQIFQEVSSVQSTTLSSGIITNRRAIESNVLVDDGQIIVLGGLIEERVEGGEQKVPGLGDVPVLGQLFRYDNRRRVKTNLLVFLRPVIVRDSDGAHSITADRYEFMRAARRDASLPPHWALPDFEPDELAAMPQPPGVPDPRGAPPSWGEQPAPAAAAAGTRRAAEPGSLSPEVDAAIRREPAPIYESRPTTINPVPAGGTVPPGAPAPGTMFAPGSTPLGPTN
ncbi:MAG: type II secretion system secretin GspD [Limnobacter sp.]|nr:type II secretion system secretin GspD [Limnobacter sp.]